MLDIEDGWFLFLTHAKVVTVAADAVAAVAAATRTVVGQVLKKSRNMSASATEIFTSECSSTTYYSVYFLIHYF